MYGGVSNKSFATRPFKPFPQKGISCQRGTDESCHVILIEWMFGLTSVPTFQQY